MSFNLDKMYCGAIGRGDVVICEVDGKEKVIAVLQDGVLNESLPTVLGATVQPYEKGDEALINEVLLKGHETGLGKDGICMLHKLVTVDRRSVVAKKGELGKDRLKEIFRALDITCGRFRDRKSMS